MGGARQRWRQSRGRRQFAWLESGGQFSARMGYDAASRDSSANQFEFRMSLMTAITHRLQGLDARDQTAFKALIFIGAAAFSTLAGLSFGMFLKGWL